MLGELLVVLISVTAVVSDCDNSITVEGVPTANGNDVVNGEYVKINIECNSRDVFNHTTNGIFLRHYEGDQVIGGTWVFSTVKDCGDEDPTNQHVRAPNENEFNPGLVQTGWQEQLSPGNWDLVNDIDVDCYDIPRCRYRITGATNDSLNVYYDKEDGYECEFRDVHKHESRDLYLYFKWSDAYNEYYWVVNSVRCQDAIYNGAVLQNDDYSVSPELILDEWQEFISGSYAVNAAIDVDCFDDDPGLSAGAIAGIVIGSVAGVALIAVGGYFIDKSCKKNKVGGSGKFDR